MKSSGIYKCILYRNRSFWLIVVCFYGFQCNSSAVCESLKGFFCDLQTAWRLVLSMKPWSYIWLEIGLFSTVIAIIRACACWALFVVTLTITVHLIYTYIYIYKHRVPGREPRSSTGNTSSNPQVSALVPRPAVNGMERMCQRHGSDQTSTLLFESKNHVSIHSYNIIYAEEEFLSVIPNSVIVWSLQYNFCCNNWQMQCNDRNV